jgi:hypothetical protein
MKRIKGRRGPGAGVRPSLIVNGDMCADAFRIALMAASLLLLAACQRLDSTHSESLADDALMRLPFPGWQADGQGHVQEVDLSAIAGRKDKTAPSRVRATITPIQVAKLDDTHAVMLTETVPGNGDASTCHMCSATMGAYFFERDETGWRLTARQDAVAESGVFGHLGETAITKLDGGHYAATVQWESCWQGYCGSWLVVVGLRPGHATRLGSAIPLTVDSDGAHGSCRALDNPKIADDEAKSNECLDIRSSWQFQGKRLIVAFEGRLSEFDKTGKLLPVRKIAQQAVYEVSQDELKLVTGDNPVPGF